MSAYQKPDGKWYVLQKIDSTNSAERPANESEIPVAEPKPVLHIAKPTAKKKAGK